MTNSAKIFSRKLVAASMASKGHTRNIKEATTITVLSGEYTGTWTIRRSGIKAIIMFDPHVSSGIPIESIGGKMKALHTWLEQDLVVKTGTTTPEERWQYWFTQLGLERSATTKELQIIHRLKSHKDRVRYVKGLQAGLTTHQALPPWCKRIPKWKRAVDIILVGVETNFETLRILPINWYQLLQKEIENTNRNEWHTAELTMCNFLTAFRKGSFSSVGITKVTEMRSIRSQLTSREIDSILDILRTLSNIDDDFIRMQRGGRSLLQAREDRKWKKLIKMEVTANVINGLHWDQRMRNQRISISTQNVEETRKGFIPVEVEGVTELLTREQFIAESATMSHCVSGFFASLYLRVFHIDSPDGGTTLGINKGKGVFQHYGEGNRHPTAQEQRKAEEILAAI